MKKEKEQRLQELKEKLKNAFPGKIDAGVKELCDWFNSKNIITWDSCAGHPKYLYHDYLSHISFWGDYQQELKKLFGNHSKWEIEDDILIDIQTRFLENRKFTTLSLTFKSPKTQREINQAWKIVLEIVNGRELKISN